MIPKLKDRRPPPKKLAVLLVAAAVLSVGVGVAATGGFFSSSGVTWGTDSGLTVEQGQDIDGVSITWQDSDTLTIENTTVDSAGDTWVRLDQRTGTYTRLSKVNASQADIGIDPPDKNRIVVGGGIDSIDFRNASVDTGDSVFSYTASTTGSVTLVQTGVTNTQVIAVASDGTVVDSGTTDSNGSLTLDQLDSGSYSDITLKTTEDPSLSNAAPSGGTTVSETPVNLSINISDQDFNELQGDSVKVSFYLVNNSGPDKLIGNNTVTSNGTAEVEWKDPVTGNFSWYVIAEDSYGGSAQSKTFDASLPNELKVYNESDPDSLVSDNAELRARFFVDGSQKVIQKQINNGTVSLSGLPADSRIVITVSDDSGNFTYRRIIIDSIIESAEIYLLPTSVNSSRINFQLDDSTGRFQSENTRLYVEKPITRNNTTEYKVITGDFFGGSGEFPADLITNERYRLRVVNDQGETRVLGSYTVSGDDTAVLPIGRIKLGQNIERNGALYGSIRKVDGQDYDHVVRITYLDQAELTDELRIKFLNSTGHEIRPKTTEQGEFGRYIESFPLYNYTEGDTITVVVEADRDGNTVTYRSHVGNLPTVSGGWPIDDGTMHKIGYVIIIAVTGLVAIANPQMAAPLGTATAFLLTVIGITPIPMLAIGVAGSASALFMTGGAS